MTSAAVGVTGHGHVKYNVGTLSNFLLYWKCEAKLGREVGAIPGVWCLRQHIERSKRRFCDKV